MIGMDHLTSMLQQILRDAKWKFFHFIDCTTCTSSVNFPIIYEFTAYLLINGGVCPVGGTLKLVKENAYIRGTNINNNKYQQELNHIVK